MTTIAIRTDTTKHRRKARKLHLNRDQVSELRRYATIGLGCGIPGLSLSLSRMGGGRLGMDGAEFVVGLACLGLCVVVLAVSLKHLADAIEDITRSPRTASWALAIAIDATLVTCELAGTFATTDADRWLRLFVMVALTVASMTLNVWSFLNPHKTAK